MTSGIADFTDTSETLDLKVMAVEYTDNDTGTVIHCFGRDASGERHHIEVDGHWPSFYIHDDAHTKRIDNHYAVHHTETHNPETGERYTTIHDEPLVRIYTHTPSQVGDMRELFDSTWEADVLYDRRWLIDEDIYTGVRIDTSGAVTDEPWLRGDMRVSNDDIDPLSLDETPDVDVKQVVIDIEVAGEDGVPDASKAKYPVSTIVAWDSSVDEYHGWLLHDDSCAWSPDDVSKDGTELDELSVFTDESSLLYDFSEWVAERQPDVLSGWYCIPEDEPVQMADGSSKPIRSVEVGDMVVGKNGEDVVTTEVTKTVKTGRRRTVEINTQHGENLHVSTDHPVLVADDNEPRYVDADDVEAGQYVLTPRELPRPDGDAGPSTTRAYQLGLIASDGSFSSDDGVVFYNTRRELHDAFTTSNALSDANGTMKQRVFTDVSRDEAVDRCAEIGLPEERKDRAEWSLEPVYGWRDDAIAAFLAGVFDGDGCVSNGVVSLHSGNESARYWIERLLRRLGIWATDGGYMAITIGSSSVERFTDTVGEFVRHSEKDAALSELSDGFSGRSETVPQYMDRGGGTGTETRRIVNDKIRRGINVKRHEIDALGGDEDELESFVFDKVTSVEKSGEEVCYDIETGTHNFVTQDRVVHNCNDFDIPYLVNRSRSCNTYKYQEWSPLGDVYLSRFDPVVKGVECIDMLDAYKKTQIHKLTSKKLDDIAEKELGRTKVERDLDHADMWREDPMEFLRYNKVDVELVHEIDVESNAMALLDNLRSVAGILASDGIGGNIDMMDVVFLRKAQEYGYALPTATKPEVGDFHGAYVYEPVAGMHEHVVYPDYSALYPSTIYQCNISPETLIGTADDLDASEYTEDDCVWTYVDMETPPAQKENVEADEDSMEKLYFVDPDIEEGFVRAVLDDVMGMCDDYTGGLYLAAKRVRNSCLTPDTEVLTPSGVVNITDVSVGDDVYSWNPETNEMEVKAVVNTIEREGEETIHHIDTNGIDLKLTDDHDLWVKRARHTDEWERTEIGETDEWTHYELPHEWSFDGERCDTVDITAWVDDYEIRVEPDCHGRTFAAVTDWEAEHNGNGVYYLSPEVFACHEQQVRDHADDIGIQTRRNESHVPMEYDAENFIQLLGWYVTEGSIYTTDRKMFGETVRGVSTMIRIAQENTEHRSEIRSLLDDMGLQYSDHSGGFIITGATALAEALDSMCGNGSHQKQLPEWVFHTHNEQRRLLLDVLMKGDGDSRDQPRYTTVSDQLRDDMCRLLVTLGKTPRYGSDTGVWRISWRRHGTNSFRRHRSVTTEAYDGTVHCLTVEDNHTFVAGRNGNFSVVGNCYGVLGDSNSYGRGFRLFDWRLAEGTTLGGQKVLKSGADRFIEAIDDEDVTLVGGDTDSFITALPNASSGDEALAMADEATETVNEWIDGYAADTFGLDDPSRSRMELELESYASRVFFKGANEGRSDAGTKKKYVQRIEWNDDDGWLDEPDIDIKGFAYVRSDIAAVTGALQYETLSSLMTMERDEAREHVTDTIRTAITAIMTASTGLSEYYDGLADLGIPFGMSQSLSEYGTPDRRPQPQYRGAKYANSEIYGTDAIVQGDKPLYFYIDGIEMGSGLRKTYDAHTAEDGDYVDCISVLEASDMPDGVSIDREKMVEKTIIDPIAPIMRTLGWGVEWMYDAVEDAKPPEAYRDEQQAGFEDFGLEDDRTYPAQQFM